MIQEKQNSFPIFISILWKFFLRRFKNHRFSIQYSARH